MCARRRLTDLPHTFSKLPMVDLFLSENEFTTIPKAVMGGWPRSSGPISDIITHSWLVACVAIL